MEEKTVVIGLTGQTGAGKSTVSGLLVSRGFRVIDADLVARQVVQKGKKCLLDLALEFGIEILDSDGNLNRRKLAAIVFPDRVKRRRLNQITFPYIQEEILEQIKDFRRGGDTVIVLDAPTLLESGSDKFCDKVVSVIAPREIRLERILSRDSLTLGEAEARMSAQQEDDFYTSRSDFVIRNGGDMTSLRVQVVEMLELCCRGVKRPDSAPEEEAGE